MPQAYCHMAKKGKGLLPAGSGLFSGSRQNCQMALEKLKTLRGDRTLEALSGDTGISVSQLSRYENGKRDPSLADLRTLADALGARVTDIIDEPTLQKVPVLGDVGAGGTAHFAPHETGEVIEADVPPGTVAVRIRGTSLGFGFDGWFALYARRFEPFEPHLFNRLCIVETQDGRVLIKWVRRGPGRGVNLVSGTGEVEEDVMLARAALVIDLRPE